MTQDMKTRKKAVFDGLCVVPFAGIILCALYVLSFLLHLSDNFAAPEVVSSAASSANSVSGLIRGPLFSAATLSTSSPFVSLFTGDSLLNLVFVLIFFALFIALFVSLLYHKNVSHIGFVLAFGGLILIYCLAKLILLSVSFKNSYINAILFYALALVGCGFMIYFYILKGLDGDANFRYFLVFGLTCACLYFAMIGQYSFFDTYTYKGNSVFWISLFGSRIILYSFIAATIVSVKSDYDPNPIQLDEFGNPIDQKKTQVTPKKGS